MAATVEDVISYTRQLAQTDLLGIGDTLGVSLYNDSLQTFHRDLLNRGIDASQTQEAYRDLTTQSPNTYLFPDDMYMLKTIEVNWQDQTEQNYLQAVPMDVANIQNVSFSWLRANQNQQSPVYDNRGDQFEIFPTPQVANAQGIRIFYYLTPTEATSIFDSVVYPLLLDYRTASCKMTSLYYKSQNNPEMAAVYDAEYQQRVDKIIKILAPGTQQPLTPQPLAISGWQY